MMFNPFYWWMQQGRSQQTQSQAGWPQGNVQQTQSRAGWPQGNAQQAQPWQGWPNAQQAQSRQGWPQGNMQQMQPWQRWAQGNAQQMQSRQGWPQMNPQWAWQQQPQSQSQSGQQRPQQTVPVKPVKNTGAVPGGKESRQSEKSAEPEQTKTLEKQNLHYSAQDLSEQDLAWIATLYGISNIEEIYDVTGMQEMMIKNQSQVKNSYVIQLMIRTKLKLEPISFREQIDKICKKLDNLRSNYVYIKTEHPYRVVLKNRTADVSFVDLSEELKNETEMKIHDMLENLMEADRLTGFDLERSSLLRVLIYKLDKEDTYAFLISQPHVNSDGISVMMLFRDLFIAYGLKQISGVELPMMESSFREYAEYLKSVDKDKEIAYWKEYLADVGEPLALPGYTPSQLDYELNLFTQAFNEETVKKLHRLQKSTGATFATIIQATWAILLARLTNSKNVVFGSVTSGRDSEVANSMRISGGFINTLLLNCKTESDRQFADLARNLQEDYGNAMKYSHCSPDEIRQSMGRETPFCNHLLNFHNYNRGNDTPASGSAIPGIEILGMDVYDNLSYDLALYFRKNEDGRYGCNFAYNSRTYSRETIQLLGECLSRYLDTVAETEGELTVGEFPELDFDLFMVAQDAIKLMNLKKAAFLKGNKLFASISDQRLQNFAENCSRQTFMQSERIYGPQDSPGSVYIVMEGFVEVSLSKQNGWERDISVEGPGSILSLSAITRMPTRMRATALSSSVTILEMPVDEFLSLMREETEMMRQVVQMLENKWMNYVGLWANAE